jgi:phosphate uptake regulator
MKRKVIKQGNGTLTITLPKEWCNRINLKDNSYIDINEHNNTLNISVLSEDDVLKSTVDLKNIKSKRAIDLLLSTIHKNGFDEIEILYDNPKILNQVENLTKELFIGFAILEQSQKRIILRSISKDSFSELEPALRRAFLVTFTLAESILEKMKKNDFEAIDSLLTLEKTNNQLTNFCERLIIKNSHFIGEKAIFKYILAWNIEKICDIYKDICMHIKENKIKTMSNQIIIFFQEILLLFREIYELVYDFKIEKYDAFIEKRKNLHSKLLKVKLKSIEEYKLIVFLDELLDKITHFYSPALSLNYIS